MKLIKFLAMMTQKDKELLLQDLCARLPYGVKCRYQHIQYVENGKIIDINRFGRVIIDGHIKDICDIKPYLFPLSSMTEEQKKELENLGWYFDNFEIHNVNECIGTYREHVAHSDCFVLIDWCNKNHFDYRGLIPKDLAIDATRLNIY